MFSLNLTHNRGLSIHLEAFKYTPKLKSLYIGDLNLTSLTKIGLQYLTGLSVLDIHGNDIKRVDIAVILSLQYLTSLDISGNDITGLPNNTLSHLSKLKSIKLVNNPWDCTCEIYWIQHLPENSADKVICNSPTKYKYITAVDINPSNLLCTAVSLSCSAIMKYQTEA